ncbi:hypothetical protein CHS0354_009409 [Potamilus streckersoni]|uniref:Uncharacterized protein n=1 Tax=Potamilus streckersoni TaxID=2493646 RepID=A0AAE0T465_9BIVA|nr:hypothetical protein CHS0354_009409 [Potamilus streckersoni]
MAIGPWLKSPAALKFCDQDNEVRVSFMSKPLIDDVIIAGYTGEHFIINCAEISRSGVERKVINGFVA